MPYDMPYVSQTMLSGVRSPVERVRPIEPMLLVHQERTETLRLIVAALARGLRSLLNKLGA